MTGHLEVEDHLDIHNYTADQLQVMDMITKERSTT